MGIDFGGAGGPDSLFDLLGQHGEVVFGDGAALAGLPHPVDDLAAAERLADAGALDNGQTGGFHGGETPPAFGALAAAPDR